MPACALRQVLGQSRARSSLHGCTTKLFSGRVLCSRDWTTALMPSPSSALFRLRPACLPLPPFPSRRRLLTQFWDTAPATGPVDSWTVHGLWPDRCDGTYESYCDRRRQYDDIGTTIQEEDPELFEYMSVYWKDYKGDDERFWEHEWNKHGTCISTLEPNCYQAYTPREELVDYFQKTVELFKGLDTYQVS